MGDFKFRLLHQDKTTRARVGEMMTPHGVIKTPAFVPCGTQATVKSLTPEELKALNIEIFFVNTYHMAMRPGIEVVEKLGGLHRFMNWDRPLMTDSGGFQVFSLSRGKLVKIDEEGVTFQSHWDGATHRFTPEVSMDYQWRLGSDIHVAFDDCTPYPVTYESAKRSMERTHRWAKRSLKAHRKVHSSQLAVNSALYGVIQGSVFKDLREKSADFISGMDLDGIAIGGVSVGEGKYEMREVCHWVVQRLPKEKPRHLLGVGEIDDIFTLIEAGIDTFDCVMPTRLGRMGHLFQMPNDKWPVTNEKKFMIDIMKKVFAEDKNPIDQNCSCYTCQNFSRAYLHHLFRVRELLGYRLATIHNLAFVTSLVAMIRESLIHGNFHQLKSAWLRRNHK